MGVNDSFLPKLGKYSQHCRLFLYSSSHGEGVLCAHPQGLRKVNTVSHLSHKQISPTLSSNQMTVTTKILE